MADVIKDPAEANVEQNPAAVVAQGAQERLAADSAPPPPAAKASDAAPAVAPASDAAPAAPAAADAAPRADAPQAAPKPGDTSQPTALEVTDPTNLYGDARNTPGEVPLTTEQQKALDEHMTKFQADLAAQNFTLNPLKRGEGPYQSIEQMGKDGKLPPGFTHQDILSEARRIRDRDFKELGRNYYKVGEAPVRWNEAEVKAKVDAERQGFRDQMLKEEAEKKAREAAAAAEAQRQAQELAQNVDKNVPKVESIAAAQSAAGLTGDANELREKIKANVASEVASGALKPEDLATKSPSQEAVYLASGKVSPEDLATAKANLAKHTEQAAAHGGVAPTLKSELSGLYSNDQGKKDGLEQADKLYNSIKEAADKARADEAAAAKAKADADAAAAKAKAEADAAAAKAKAEADRRAAAPPSAPVAADRRVVAPPSAPAAAELPVAVAPVGQVTPIGPADGDLALPAPPPERKAEAPQPQSTQTADGRSAVVQPGPRKPV